MSKPRLTTALLPDLIADEDFFGRTAVIIDVLRASTTMIHMLANGADSVIPCLTVESVTAAKAEHTDGRLLTGGERGGVKVPGFDLGNSPTEYDPAVVADATIAFSTTNGTRAIDRARAAAEIIVGSFANLDAIVQRTAPQKSVALVCAGTNGVVSREDVLFAGAVAEELCRLSVETSIDDSTRIALAAWREVRDAPLRDALAESQGGRNLAKIGQASDIATAALLNSHQIIPEFRNGRIRAI